MVCFERDIRQSEVPRRGGVRVLFSSTCGGKLAMFTFLSSLFAKSSRFRPFNQGSVHVLLSSAVPYGVRVRAPPLPKYITSKNCAVAILFPLTRGGGSVTC